MDPNDDNSTGTCIEAETPRAGWFQYRLKHLLALPIVVALVCGILVQGRHIEGILLTVLAACGVCAIFRPTRKVSAVAGSVILMLLGLAVWVSMNPVRRRSVCKNNLKQLGLALTSYHSAKHSFPAAYAPGSPAGMGEEQRSARSWRIAILPFLEHEALYDLYDSDEPWNGPKNKQLVETRPDVFHCPRNVNEPAGMTSYVAVVGPKTVWPGGTGRRLEDIVDGASNAILLAEVHNSGIFWTEPRDLHVVQMTPGVNPTAGQGISSARPEGAHILLADGSVQYLWSNVSPDIVKSLITIDDGTPTDWRRRTQETDR